LWFEPEPNPILGQGRLPKDFETVKETSKGHGRLEERTLTVSSQLNDLGGLPGHAINNVLKNLEKGLFC